jgi:hypothetical protein
MYSKSVFLVINHITRVAKGVASHKKSAANNPDNYEVHENMILADRVSKANQISASVIIDLLNGKVLKNRFSVDSTQVFKEYVDKYQTEIGDALRRWGTQNPDNYKKLKGLATEAEGTKTDDT